MLVRVTSEMSMVATCVGHAKTHHYAAPAAHASPCAGASAYESSPWSSGSSCARPPWRAGTARTAASPPYRCEPACTAGLARHICAWENCAVRTSILICVTTRVARRRRCLTSGEGRGCVARQGRKRPGWLDGRGGGGVLRDDDRAVHHWVRTQHKAPPLFTTERYHLKRSE